jgi:hypothetical protein
MIFDYPPKDYNTEYSFLTKQIEMTAAIFRLGSSISNVCVAAVLKFSKDTHL